MRISHRFGICAIFALSLLCSATAARTGPPRDRPNIVFILADDLGYGEVGVYGQEKIRTPNLDLMAAEGLRFTDGYAGAPICMPSRLSLLTGRHVGHLRVNTNAGPPGFLARTDVTIAELLKKAGYATAVIGKWGVGSEPGVSLPNDKGFDYAVGYPDDMTAHEHFPPALWRNGKREDVPENVGGMHGRYSDDIFADEAVRFIDAHRTRPFFLYLPFTIPHAQLEVPTEALKEYAGAFPEKPWMGAAASDPYARYYPTPVLQPNATRAAMITRLDGYVGRIMRELAKQGLDRKTLIIFTSDNGPTPEGGSDLAFFRSSGPFTGGKLDLHEGAIREPMIARWPGVIAAGRIDHTPIAFWDFLPTFSELAHAPSAPNDGVSIVPLLTGDGRAPEQRDLYWEFGGRSADGKLYVKQAIRRGDLKGLRLSADRAVEVFNLANDPAELHDLAAQQPADAARFKSLMDAYLAARIRTTHQAGSGSSGRP